jgi:nucleoside-diphosphate-sugar epimerase
MILVTGGAGAMGSVLVARLREQGERVRVFCLPGDPGAGRLEQQGVEVRFGDVADAEQVRGVCEGVSVVYHLAAVIIAFDSRVFERVNVGGTRLIVEEAQRAGVRHFIQVSSASVVYPKSTAYARSKLEGERIVRESELPATIVRPTLVYDERGGAEFNAFLEYLRRFPVVPFIGKGRARKRPVHVEELVDGLAAIHGREVAVGKTYNLSGAESITMYDFARLCLRLLGMQNKQIVSLPVWLCVWLSKAAGLVMGRPPLRWQVIAGVIQDADLDPGEAMRDLGYRPSRVSERLPFCFPRRA